MFELYSFDPVTWGNGYFLVASFATEELCHAAATKIPFYRIEQNLGWGARIVFQTDVADVAEVVEEAQMLG